MRLSLFPSLRPPAPPPDQHAEEGEMEGPLQAACMLNHPSATSVPGANPHSSIGVLFARVWMTLLLCVSVWSSRQLFDMMLYYVVFNKEQTMF